jgi:predicted unusual protein kinase regulating ubiquinone biosynthesis (AarF/ABC1/UbiB family)
MRMSNPKNLSKIKSSVFSRSLSLARLTVSSGTKLFGSKLQSSFRSEEEKKAYWTKFLTQSASEFADEFGQLKGSIMKAGQMLSMYGEYFLPKEANDFLKSLQSNSPALVYPEIHKILVTELGNEKLDELEIETKPIGTASMGQVHRAKIKKTGEWITLKVQYPGVEAAIKSDLKALRSIMSLIKVLPKGASVDHIFAEIHGMLKQELDYEFEKAETIKYGNRLKGDPRYIVPKIFERYCTKRVIATSFENGIRADDSLIQQLPEERRNRIALSYLDLYFRELFEWGIVQTDPHLGNYAIRLDPKGEDKLILFDFGAVRSYPQAFLKPYYRMIKASVEDNRLELRAAAQELKFIEPTDPPELIEYFERFCLSTVEPFLEPNDPRLAHDPAMLPDGRYDWKKSELPSRLTKIVWEMFQKFELRAPPQEILFLDRKTGGVFVFESVLGAKIRGRDLLLPSLKKALD